MLPSDNVWNTRIDSLPVAANSDTLVSTIGTSNPLHPDYGAGGGFFYNLVPGSQPKVPVTMRYISNPGPYPIPANVAIENASDGHSIIVDTTNCILYELFDLVKQSDGSWLAGSGAIFPLTSNQLIPNGYTSADAAGLPILPGLVRYDEVIAGHIDHAIRFTAPQTRNTWMWPARHEASALTGAQYPQFGQRFRLKADFDISSFPAHVQVILQAMKTYGIMLADNGASWHIAGVGDTRWNDDEMHQMTRVVGADFEAVDESSLMVDPNSGQAHAPSGSAPPPPPAPGIPTGWVNIISENSGKCLDISGGPAAVRPGVLAQQWTCVGGTNQEFQFLPVSGGYRINVRNSGLALDIVGGPAKVTDGILLQQWPYWGGANQIFNVLPTNEGHYTIRPKNSGLCLDVSHISRLDGALMQQWSCNGNKNQDWSFVPTS